MKKISNLFALLICLGFFSGFVFVDTVSAQRKNTRTTRTQTEPALPKAVRPINDTLTEIRRKNRLDVGISTFVPWAMHDKNGELIGYEVEVAKKLADDLGVELKFHPVGFSEIIPDLVNNRFDIIVTGIYPTPQRALFVNFSEPYADSKIEFVASREKMKRADDRDDFNKSDVTVGVVKGTVYGDYVKDNFPNARLQEFDQEDEMFQAVSDGTVAAGVASTPGPEFAMKLYKDKLYRPFGNPLGRLGESFAIRRGDTDFLNYLNTWIRYYEQNGWLKQERRKWFDNDDWLSRL